SGGQAGRPRVFSWSLPERPRLPPNRSPNRVRRTPEDSGPDPHQRVDCTIGSMLSLGYQPIGIPDRDASCLPGPFGRTRLRLLIDAARIGVATGGGHAMDVVFVASEAVPFAKTGGLADVAGALPRALEHQGHRATLFLPCYRRARLAGPE